MEENRKIILVDSSRVHPLHILAFVETFLIVLAVGFFAGKFLYEKNSSASVNSITVLNDRISDIGELVTLQYDYDAVEIISHEKAKFYKLQIPLTDDSLELSISGTIKYGVNLRSLKIKVSEDSGGNIVVTLPKAEIVSHELDHGSAAVNSIKSGAFRPVSFSGTFKEANDAFEKIKASRENSEKSRACIETATQNAKLELERILRPLIPAEKSLQFEFK